MRGVERLRAWCEGFSLHAGVVIADHDREALERLCRYGTRPAFAHDRLAWTADGQIAYRLKRPWPDGRTELVLPPVAFLRRLCGIIPPPRRHLVRYAGVFGPASQRRAQLRALVPARGGEPPPAAATPSGSTRAGRVPWAELLRRVFATDVLSCPCGGRRSVIAVVVDSALARAVLAALGLPCTPTTFAPARDPPQGELWFDDTSYPTRPPTRPAGDGSARTSTQCAPADTAGIWWCPPARRSSPRGTSRHPGGRARTPA